MQSFISFTFGILALLHDTVPILKHIWIECLGDICRYRMAFEYDDEDYRNTWRVAAETWYLNSSDLSPNTGHLYQ